MTLNSKAKGKKGEQEFINLHLRPHWPGAARNIDQHRDDKRDCVEVAGVHWQVKRVEKLNVWAAMDQARSEARDVDVPVVAMRKNRTPWLCVLDAEEFIPLLRLREA